jgi:hypothetical protein
VPARDPCPVIAVSPDDACVSQVHDPLNPEQFGIPLDSRSRHRLPSRYRRKLRGVAPHRICLRRTGKSRPSDRLSGPEQGESDRKSLGITEKVGKLGVSDPVAPSPGFQRCTAIS